MARNSRALPTALAEEDALSEPTCGTSGDYRCGTFLLYSLPGFSNYSSDQWSYGDSNPRPLACHPAATRPPECVAAGHRPGECTQVRLRPGRLRYFPAVPFSPPADPKLPRAYRSAGTFPVSDVGNELERLAGYRRHGVVTPCTAKPLEPLALRGSGDKQINRASRSVRPGFGQHLLNFIRTLVCSLGHRHPAEQVMHHLLLFQPVSQRPRGIEELQLDDRANRDDARDKLVRPRLPQLTLQDPEQA